MSSTGPTLERWAEIRRRYENAEPIARLAREYHTTRGTIKRHARAESWLIDASQAASQVIWDVKATPQELARATKSNIIMLSTKRAFEQQSPEVRQAVFETIEDLLQRQLPLAAKATTFAESVLTRAESGELQPNAKEGWSGFSSGIVAAAAKAAELTREIAGLKSGQPSVAFAKTKMQRRFTVVEAPPPETKAKAAS